MHQAITWTIDNPIHWHVHIAKVQLVNMLNHFEKTYGQISNISHTKFQNLNVSRLVLQLSLLNPLKACVKSRMKM